MYTYLPDLLAIQLASFRHFLALDLADEVQKGLHNLPTSLGPLHVPAKFYKVTPPRYSPQRAIQQIRTYGTVLYVPMSISGTPGYGPKYHALASLPLLTDTSYFIVNGVRRVVVNQMVRCPNIYCKTKVLANNSRTYTISFVSARGAWLRFERDKEGEIWVRINDLKKIQIGLFLRALGVSKSLLEQTFPPQGPYFSCQVHFDEKLTRSAAYKILTLMKGSKTKMQKKFDDEVFKMQRASQKNSSLGSHEIGRQFLFETLFGGHQYSLTRSGRMRINRRVGLNSTIPTLQPEDALAGLEILFRLENGKLYDNDIDHLQNRRVRLLQDILAEEIRRGMKRLRNEEGVILTHSTGHQEILGCSSIQTEEEWKSPSSTLLASHEHPYQMAAFETFYTNDLCQHSELQTHTPLPPLVPAREDNIGHQGALQACQTASPHYSHPIVQEIVPQNQVTLKCKSKYVTRTLREFFGLNSLSQFMDQINPLASITQKRRLTCLGPGGVSRQSGLDIRDIHQSHYGRICPIETPEGKNAGLVNSLASHANISPEGYIESQYISTLPMSPRPARIFLQPEHEIQRVFYPSPFRPTQNGGWNASVQDTNGERWQATDVRLTTVSPIAMISVATSLIPFLEHDDGNRALMASNMQRQAVPLLFSERPIVGTGLEARVARDSRTVVLTQTSGQVIYVDGLNVRVRRSYRLNEPSQKTSYRTDTFQLEPFSRSNHDTIMYQTPCVNVGDIVHHGDLLANTSTTAHGELALGKNALVAYMPWEGYNFEDAVVLNQCMVTENAFTSIHIEKVRTQTQAEKGHEEEFYIPLGSLATHPQKAYDWYGILRPGTFITQGNILVGKRRPNPELPTPEERLLYDIFEMHRAPLLDCSLRVDHDLCGRIFETFFFPQNWQYTKGAVEIHLLISRPIQIGDKIAGRHGNKGIISNILPPSDMPYLRDGTPMDIVLNPLGVPSRMNVGQIFECLLGLAGTQSGHMYRVCAFDEMYGPSASHFLVSSALRNIAQQCWWINSTPHAFGKVRLFDGRTGVLFEHPVTVGVAYILKLIHLVDKKIHARATGAYALITQQPLKGRSANGGQRVGEMEVWALQGFSASYVLQEMLTVKADDCSGRYSVTDALLHKLLFPTPFAPESFRLLLSELRALCFDITYETSRKAFQKAKPIPPQRQKRKSFDDGTLLIDVLPQVEE